MGNLSSGDCPGEDGVTRTEDADADGFFTCERCGKRKPVGFTCACGGHGGDRKSTRLNSSHVRISYAVFCLKKKNNSTGCSGAGVESEKRLRVQQHNAFG